MSRNTSSRRVIGISVVGFALAAGATSGAASTAAADPISVAATNTIRACVKKSGGAIRYEASAVKDCRSSETLVSWNRKGVKGATGAKGLPGLVGEKGDVGETGAIGPIGPIGLTGLTGNTGPSGATGSVGAAGSAGTAGKTILSDTATGAPGSGLGAAGDFYIEDSDGVPKMWGPKPSNGAWAGGPGISLVGANGTAGATIVSGSAAPTTEGLNGDFYLRTGATPSIYGPKTTGAWGSATSLTGAAGPSMVTGTVPPTTEGVNGDYYLRTGTVPSLYGPKASGAWGAAKLHGVAGYERVTGSTGYSASTAICSAGKKVVGGGYMGSLDIGSGDTVDVNYATADDTWTAALINVSTNASITAYAICLTM